jgi:CRP-like cAMP-binding protein
MIVKEIELFKDIDYAVINKMICVEENYSKDTVLFEKGQDATFLYILVAGTINLVIQNGGSLTYTLTEPGEVFGWSSMVESGQYTASGVCATDVKAVKIEKEMLDKIFSIHPEAGLKILKRLAGVVSRRLSNAYRDLLSARRTDATPSYG